VIRQAEAPPDVPYTIEILAIDTAELMHATGFIDAGVG
jgi:hypothetical protein